MPDPLWPQLLLQLVLILINAFFASAEIAVISLNENKLRVQAEEGDKKAARMLKMVQTPASFLSTIQIGITLAGFLGSAFAAENLASRFVTWMVDVRHVTSISPSTLNTLAVVGVTIILSYFTLVLGELVPKRIAMQKSEQVASFACGVVSAISVVMRPIIWFLSLSTNGLLRLLGLKTQNEEETMSEDEIRMIVDRSEERGIIESEEREMIENIFEFNNQTAESVMVHRTDMEVIRISDSRSKIIELIESTGLSRFPVYDEDIDDILGTLSTRVYLLSAQNGAEPDLRKLLRPTYFVPESVRADVLFRDMQARKEHMAIVVDEYGGTSGLVTMEDLLETIVGNIYDEFDPQAELEIIPQGENLWRVSGNADLEELGEAMGLEFPEGEEYDTLGGLVFSQLSAIPDDGSHPEVEAGGVHIYVETLTDRRVEWALVSRLVQQTPDETHAED